MYHLGQSVRMNYSVYISHSLCKPCCTTRTSFSAYAFLYVCHFVGVSVCVSFLHVRVYVCIQSCGYVSECSPVSACLCFVLSVSKCQYGFLSVCTCKYNCVYNCVCIYLCMLCTCTSVYLSVFPRVFRSVCVYVCMQVFLHVFKYVCTYLFLYMFPVVCLCV